MKRLPLFKDAKGRPAHTKEDGSDWSHAEWLQAVVGELGEYARPLRLAVAPSCSPYFRIMSMMVGNMQTAPLGREGASAEFFPPLPHDARPSADQLNTFFRGSEGVSAEMFPALPETPEEIAVSEAFLALGFDTCSVAQRCTLLVRNDHHQPQSIEAILWGVFAEP
jgi:hypothetical protein